MAEGFEEILEHHRNQRLVLYHQDATLPHTATGISRRHADAKPFNASGWCQRLPRRFRELLHRKGFGEEGDLVEVDRLAELLLGIA
jgi:hypothetical protein